jgi:CMP-N,N'-diacetyllegionaminic acid synthase
MKTLAIIPARGGSKGILRKNLQILAGKTLLEHALEYCDKCRFDMIVVSTDNDEIAKVAQDNMVTVVRRPKDLSDDTSLVIDAIRYTVKSLYADGTKPDVVFLIEPTSPLREVALKEVALQKILEGYDSVATFAKVDPAVSRIWVFNSEELPEPLLTNANPFSPRQKQIQGYRLTGQLYATTYELLKNESTRSVMSGKVYPIIVNNNTFIDIDTLDDLKMADVLYKLNNY